MSIELVRRYLVTLDRQYRNTLLNLRQYQKDFAANAIPEEEEEKPKAPEPQPSKALPAEPNEPERKPVTAEIRPYIVVKPALNPPGKSGEQQK
jgi:hypothetical protein